MTDRPVVVRGPATADEVAAVLAALRPPDPRPAADRYERWRATRLAALKCSVSRRLR